jgi:hypothetical protein
VLGLGVRRVARLLEREAELGQESPFPAVDAKVRSSRKRTFLARAGNDWVSPISDVRLSAVTPSPCRARCDPALFYVGLLGEVAVGNGRKEWDDASPMLLFTLDRVDAGQGESLFLALFKVWSGGGE